MAKTLHYVVRVTVPDYITVENARKKIEYVTNRFPVTKYTKPHVWRPRGKLGAMIRELDKAS